MADFCWDCTETKLGVDGDQNDFVGVCGNEEVACVLCEGCGIIYVDNNGKRLPEKGEAS